ncbi:hypothetical protein NC652_023886 [Populus alba x Populus x berolinensis]|nr:hypothetical protein NC652_023886 [Populus alba x Populus x berolinensis]
MICERDIYNLIALQKIPCPIKLMAPSYHLVTESPPVYESKIKHHALVEDMDENGVHIAIMIAPVPGDTATTVSLRRRASLHMQVHQLLT